MNPFDDYEATKHDHMNFALGNTVKIIDVEVDYAKYRPHSVGDYGQVIDLDYKSQMYFVKTAHDEGYRYDDKDLELYSYNPDKLMVVHGRSMPCDMVNGFCPTNTSDFRGTFVIVRQNEDMMMKALEMYKSWGYTSATALVVNDTYYIRTVEHDKSKEDSRLTRGSTYEGCKETTKGMKDITNYVKNWNPDWKQTNEEFLEDLLTPEAQLEKLNKEYGGMTDLQFGIGVTAHNQDDENLAKHLESFLNFNYKTPMKNTLDQLKFDNFIKANQSKIVKLSETIDEMVEAIRYVRAGLLPGIEEMKAANKELGRALEAQDKKGLQVQTILLKRYEKICSSKEFVALITATDNFLATIQ